MHNTTSMWMRKLPFNSANKCPMYIAKPNSPLSDRLVSLPAKYSPPIILSRSHTPRPYRSTSPLLSLCPTTMPPLPLLPMPYPVPHAPLPSIPSGPPQSRVMATTDPEGAGVEGARVIALIEMKSQMPAAASPSGVSRMLGNRRGRLVYLLRSLFAVAKIIVINYNFSTSLMSP